MAKREYEVTIPIAGHAYATVIAESADEAIEIAMGEVSIKDIETWEPLSSFHQGNVCYCPSPWHAEAADCGEVEEDTAS